MTLLVLLDVYDPALGSGVLHCVGLPLTFLIGGNVFPLIKKYQSDMRCSSRVLPRPAAFHHLREQDF